MERRYKNILVFLILVLFLALLITLLYTLGPQGIVEKIGVRNSYMVAFFVSFFGGFSAGGSISFIATLITLSIGGLNPIVLGLIAGVGLAIGDGIMFYIGFRGRRLIKGRWEKKLERFSHMIQKKAGKAIPFITYFYMGFTPFPNDILILGLAAIEYEPKKLYIPLILGDITFALLISIFAAKIVF